MAKHVLRTYPLFSWCCSRMCGWSWSRASSGSIAAAARGSLLAHTGSKHSTYHPRNTRKKSPHAAADNPAPGAQSEAAIAAFLRWERRRATQELSPFTRRRHSRRASHGVLSRCMLAAPKCMCIRCAFSCPPSLPTVRQARQLIASATCRQGGDARHGQFVTRSIACGDCYDSDGMTKKFTSRLGQPEGHLMNISLGVHAGAHTTRQRRRTQEPCIDQSSWLERDITVLAAPISLLSLCQVCPKMLRTPRMPT